MDKFPDNFTRQTCKELLEKNQSDLVKIFRKEIWDNVQTGITNCEKEINIIFPDKLWHTHRKLLTTELLSRFGKLKTKMISPKCDVVKLIMDPAEIPENIKMVTIEFWSDE